MSRFRFRAARHGHAAREALERAARRGLGDVLAPQRLALLALAAKALAVAGPQDAIVPRSAAPARCGSGSCRSRALRSGPGGGGGKGWPCKKPSAPALWIACGLLVHRRVSRQCRRGWSGGGASCASSGLSDETIFALIASYSASVMSLASSSCLASCRRRTASPSPRRLRRRAGGHLDAAGAGAQLLELAHPALLAPRLVLCLADAIHRLRLAPGAGPGTRRAARPARRARRGRWPCRRAAPDPRSACRRAA